MTAAAKERGFAPGLCHERAEWVMRENASDRRRGKDGQGAKTVNGKHLAAIEAARPKA
jgi:hypothetical protein